MILLEAGADVMPENSAGKTAWDYLQDNEALTGTDAFRELESRRLRDDS